MCPEGDLICPPHSHLPPSPKASPGPSACVPKGVTCPSGCLCGGDPLGVPGLGVTLGALPGAGGHFGGTAGLGGHLGAALSLWGCWCPPMRLVMGLPPPGHPAAPRAPSALERPGGNPWGCPWWGGRPPLGGAGPGPGPGRCCLAPGHPVAPLDRAGCEEPAPRPAACPDLPGQQLAETPRLPARGGGTRTRTRVCPRVTSPCHRSQPPPTYSHGGKCANTVLGHFPPFFPALAPFPLFSQHRDPAG